MSNITSVIIKTLGIAFLVSLIGWSPLAAQAKQTSLDHRIFEAFEKIDNRTNTHEEDVSRMRLRLNDLVREMDRLQGSIESLPTEDADEKARSQRYVLHGQMINASAEYLNLAYKLVNSAADVISANLTDLAELSTEVRQTGSSRGDVNQIQKRIEHNIAAGRSMRQALVEMRTWAQKDPGLTDKFKSLRRIAATLDRRISVDKARLTGRTKDPTGPARDKRLASLDRTVDRLGDMYSEVMAEKEALKDLRDEVAMAIQLGRLEMTRVIAEKAVPNLGSGDNPSSDVRSLTKVAKGIAKLNESLVHDTSVRTPGVRPRKIATRAPTDDLKIDGFSNF